MNVSEDLKSVFISFGLHQEHIERFYLYFLKHKKVSDLTQIFDTLHVPWQQGYTNCYKLEKMTLIRLEPSENTYYLCEDQLKCWQVILNLYLVKHLFDRKGIDEAHAALYKVKEILERVIEPPIADLPEGHDIEDIIDQLINSKK